MVNSPGDEGHRIGLVIDQVRGIRDEIIELLACGCGKLARLGSDLCWDVDHDVCAVRARSTVEE
jgi:hypothetical protein